LVSAGDTGDVGEGERQVHRVRGDHLVPEEKSGGITISTVCSQPFSAILFFVHLHFQINWWSINPVQLFCVGACGVRDCWKTLCSRGLPSHWLCQGNCYGLSSLI
jgi:hypothetical protein